MRRRASIVAAALALAGGDACAQRVRDVLGVDVQKLVNGVVGVMSYTVTPDVTTSSLAINNAATGNADFKISQFGGGFTWSRSTPLYLEGNAAYARYDTVFIASEGARQQQVPVKWNSFSATGGALSSTAAQGIIGNPTMPRVAATLRAM